MNLNETRVSTSDGQLWLARHDLARYKAAINAVRELHSPEMDVHGYQVCGFRYCYDGGEHGDQHEYPCPTVRAIEEAGA